MKGSLLAQEVAGQPRVSRLEVPQQLSEGRALPLDGRLPPDVGPEDGRELDQDRHALLMGDGSALRLWRSLAGGETAEELVVDELRDRRVLSAHRAVWIPFEPHRPELHGQRVEQQKPPNQGLTDAHDELDRLHCLDGPDNAGQHTKDTTLGARRHRARRRRLWEEAPVARDLRAGQEYRGLTLELVDRAVHQRLSKHLGGVVDQITNREVIGAVHDDFIASEDRERILGSQRDIVGDDLDVWVEIVDPFLRRFHLWLANVRCVVQKLALEVGHVHTVEVEDAQGTHPGRGEVHRRRRPEPTGPDHQDLRPEQLPLPLPPDVREDDVSGVTKNLVLGELTLRHWILTSSSTGSPPSKRKARSTGRSQSIRERMRYVTLGYAGTSSSVTGFTQCACARSVAEGYASVCV